MFLAEDKKLLERFRKGDRAAMTEVFHHYSDGLAEFLQRGFPVHSAEKNIRFTGIANRHDLHDLVSETFRKAFEERARLNYSGLVPYIGYLRSIARNLVIDRLRSRERRWLALEGKTAAEAEAIEAAESPETAFGRAEVSSLINKFLHDSSQRQRQFIKLRYEEQLAQQEVAERMGESRRWVRKQEVEVRRRLLRYLKDSGYLSASIAARQPQLMRRTS